MTHVYVIIMYAMKSSSDCSLAQELHYHKFYVALFVFIFNCVYCWPRAPGFLKLFWFARQYVCVSLSVCPPPWALITSGMIWCDIDHMRLVKQVLRLFPAFNYFI